MRGRQPYRARNPDRVIERHRIAIDDPRPYSTTLMLRGWDAEREAAATEIWDDLTGATM